MSQIVGEIPFDIFHIGLHRCGSTFLQQCVFAQHPEINCGWNYQVTYTVRRLQEYPFDFDRMQFRNDLKAAVITEQKDSGKVWVISHEGFSGEMFTGVGGRCSLEVLHSLFPRAKIILVIREPYSMLYSLWAYYVGFGGTLSFGKFLSSRVSPAQPYQQTNVFTRVMHNRILRLLHGLFGHENVKVMLYEELGRDWESYVKQIYEFVGVDTSFLPDNRRLKSSDGYLKSNVIRWSNKLGETNCNETGIMMFPLIYRPARWAIKHGICIDSKRLPKEQIKRYIPERYQSDIRKSNADLQHLLNRGLVEFGYEV